MPAGLRIAEGRIGDGRPYIPAGYSPYTGAPGYVEFQLRSPGGTLLYTLPDMFGWQCRREANRPDWCQFSYDASDERADYLTAPNEIWQHRNGALARRFAIVAANLSNATAQILTVEGDGLLARLADQNVAFYETVNSVTGEPEAKPISTILSALMAMQEGSAQLSIGSIDSAIASVLVVYKVEDRSILECLDDLHRHAGGYYYADTGARLHWKAATGNNMGHRITLTRNSRHIQRRTDWRALKTRMIGIGAGATQETSVRVVVNDATAQSTYGVRVGYFVDKKCFDLDTLTQSTREALNRAKVPRVTYDVDYIDVSRDNVWDMTFDAFLAHVGTRVYVQATDFSLWTRILSVHENGDDPLGVRLYLGNPDAGSKGGNLDPQKGMPQDIVDAVVELARRVAELEGDTGILRSIEDILDADDEGVGLDDVVTWDELGDVGTLPEAFIDALDDSQDLRDALEDFLSSNSATITYFAQVQSVHNDYLTCLRYNPVTDTTSTEIKVAKPYNLRRTPFDTETITYIDGQSIEYQYLDDSERTATDTNSLDSESQVVTPRYYVGEVIRIVYGDTGLEDGSSAPILWEDLNTAGRVWAKV